MATRSDDIVSVIKQQIQQFGTAVTMVDVGTVVEVADGLARIHGLSGAKSNELLQFPNDIMGLALNLEEDGVGAVILGDPLAIKEGDEVRSTGRILEVPVGAGLIGRVVDPLGRPLDGKGPIKYDKVRPMERVAPNVVTRAPVNVSVHTGIKAIDAVIPIGRGQRELIIGDRFTGKSAICIDTMISQTGGNLICIYAAIGQKVSKVAQLVASLEAHGAMEHSIVVCAGSSDSAPIQYICPYAACAIGEEFMEQGKDALVIYDDLSKHAWAYRQISLLLRRPPGREAYPGDIFYLHSRLLERAAKLNKQLGGGSLTALPIIETLAGDLSAYIPTNVISITDGQIFLETDLFHQGVRPAVNVGLSVSRVGGSAQVRAMRQVAGRLRLDLAQYRELAAFAQFASDLDKATQDQLARGARLVEILKQPQYQPLAVEQQVLLIYAATNGYLDPVAIPEIEGYEKGLFRFLETRRPGVLSALAAKKQLDDALKADIDAALKEFGEEFAAARAAA